MNLREMPRYTAASLHKFCVRVLQACNVPLSEADTTATVLVDADLHGIDSHGIAHLSMYVRHLVSGSYKAKRAITTVHETPATALIDGGGGLGHPAGVFAMQTAMDKASLSGTGTVVVRNSHHFGAAGYYVALALERDMVGLCMTNAGPGVLPTFGIQPLLGTNPIGLAVPANLETPFVLDMATSVKAYGKLEIAKREGKEIPEGWFLKADGGMGRQADDFPFWRAGTAERRGGMLPLGGATEATSSYKGYGLSLGVEILTALLAGDTPSALMETYAGCPEPAIAHYFYAIIVSAFQPVETFKMRMDELLLTIKRSPKLTGHDRIYIPGEMEAELFIERTADGIPLHPAVAEDLERLATDYLVPALRPL